MVSINSREIYPSSLRAKARTYEYAARNKTPWLQSIANELRLDLTNQEDLANNKLLTLAFAYMIDNPDVVESAWSGLE